ncbi:MAG: LEA type 2 family protein [Lysobacterales bacterium]
MKRKLHRILPPLAALLSTLVLAACATLAPGYEQPTVTLSSFRAIPSEGMTPGFEIGLRILNPNATPLRLDGVVYTIAVEGHELVKGVGKDFPVIEGYSQADVTLSASANLLAGIRFIGDMMQRSDDSLDYDFEAKLDLQGRYPSLRVRESGAFSLQTLPR